MNEGSFPVIPHKTDYAGRSTVLMLLCVKSCVQKFMYQTSFGNYIHSLNVGISQRNSYITSNSYQQYRRVLLGLNSASTFPKHHGVAVITKRGSLSPGFKVSRWPPKQNRQIASKPWLKLLMVKEKSPNCFDSALKLGFVT